MSPSILCLDIGSGTQDVLLHLPDREPENCPKFVLPAPARLVGQRIDALTKAGKPVYLHGANMGGGFFHALSRHLKAGLPAASHPDAAASLSDNPERVTAMGVRLSESCPAGYSPVHLADFDPGFWRAFLALAELDYPDLILAAAQDHGFHPEGKNRAGRFKLWERLLGECAGDPDSLLHVRPPAVFTRLVGLQAATGGGPVADTGAAAILGALSDPEIEAKAHDTGALVLNMGNSHVLAALLRRDRIVGVYEQHTGVLTPEELLSDLTRFRQGHLPCEEVLDRYGHGCLTLESLPEIPIYVLGPKRGLLSGFDVRFPCPGGDMMLAGCFGLLRAWRRSGEKTNA
jgi:uncharacterized protein (DUF1786 family)